MITLIIIILLSNIKLGLGQPFWQDSYQLDFNYDLESDIGPRNWENIDISNSEWEQYADGHPIFNLDIGNNECNLRVQPSPIALDVTEDCTDDFELFTRQIQSDTDCNAKDVSFEVTPHTLRAYFPEDDSTCERPTIQMDGPETTNDDPFVLQFMEIHARSEHIVDGRYFDAELQMVHMGTNNNDNQAAIISVMIEANAKGDHSQFQYMLDQWQIAVNNIDSRCDSTTNRHRHLRTDSSRMQQQQQPNKHAREGNKTASWTRRNQGQQDQCTGDNCGPRKRMFPYNMWPSVYYFRYSGSLTTPPCSSIVQWRIIDRTMKISRRQYKQLTKLMTTYKDDNCNKDTVVSLKGENSRPLRTMNPNFQSVSHCTPNNFNVTLYDPDLQ
jgi:carbonic anhydrase